MRSHVAVAVAPGGQDRSRMRQAMQEGLSQTFVAQASDEALDGPVLLRLARHDVVPGDATPLMPAQHRVRDRLGR